MSHPYFVTRRACPACRGGSTRNLRSVSYQDALMRDYLDRFYSQPGGVEHPYLREACYQLDECLECGLLFQRQIPDEMLMNRLYGQWISPDQALEQYESRHRGPYYVMLAREIACVVDYFGPPFSRLKLFDFGMGWGHWCLLAKGFGCEVYGCELSPLKIQRAQANAIRTVQPQQLPVAALDYIHTEQVFEHLPDPLGTLMHLTEALKPGGLIKIAVPNGWDIKRKLTAWDWTAPKGSPNSLNAVAPLEHINCFHHDTLIHMARKAGLVPVPDLTPERVDRRTPPMISRAKAAVRPAYHTLKRRLIGKPHIKSSRLHFAKPMAQHQEMLNRETLCA